jgi:multicomponent Na+:H+ antiporter subunit D
MLALLFFLNAFALVGVPPTSGFWGKYLLVVESFQERFVWGGIALATGVLTLYSMVKIWLEGFWKALPESSTDNQQAVTSLLPAYAAVIVLSLVIIWMGLYPEPLIAFLTAHSTDFWSIP